MNTILNKETIKRETEYLNNKEQINQYLLKFNWSYILRVMIERLDQVDDLNQSQSLEMFKLISSLEDALQSYYRLYSEKTNVQKN